MLLNVAGYRWVESRGSESLTHTVCACVLLVPLFVQIHTTAASYYGGPQIIGQNIVIKIG